MKKALRLASLLLVLPGAASALHARDSVLYVKSTGTTRDEAQDMAIGLGFFLGKAGMDWLLDSER